MSRHFDSVFGTHLGIKELRCDIVLLMNWVRPSTKLKACIVSTLLWFLNCLTQFPPFLVSNNIIIPIKRNKNKHSCFTEASWQWQSQTGSLIHNYKLLHCSQNTVCRHFPLGYLIILRMITPSLRISNLQVWMNECNCWWFPALPPSSYWESVRNKEDLPPRRIQAVTESIPGFPPNPRRPKEWRSRWR